MTGESVRIELRRKGRPSLWTIIDAEDAPRVRERSWHVLIRPHTMYAQTSVQQNYRRFSILLHRYIVDAPADRKVDHRNGDGLDNRKANLRVANDFENAANSRPTARAASRYKGVKLEYGKWVAVIHHQGRTERLGVFADEITAARAYDHRATDLHRDFAWLNFPEEHMRGA